MVCHRFAGFGGATGPDLTQAAGRFGVKELAEAIIDPSKVIAEQYGTTVVRTNDGKTYTGRKIPASPDSIRLLIDPEDASKSVTINLSDIDEQNVSPVSMMPKGLLNALNEDEVLDLFAYVLSRGDPHAAVFQPYAP